MSRRPARGRKITAVTVVAVLFLALLFTVGGQAGAATPSSTPTTSSTVAELPPAEMIPQPDSGQEPTDAGDRGGSLQLLVLGLVLVGVGGGVAKLVHDARRARAGGDGLA